MGLESFQIVLDKPTSTFVVSKTKQTLVTGKVLLASKKTQHIQGLRLDFKGTAKVEWTSQNGKKSHSSQENYFHYSSYLAGDGKESQVLVGSEEQCIPFRLALPPGLPSSCRTPHGKITYKIQAAVQRAWKLSVVTRQYLEVVAPVELNTTAEYLLPSKTKCVEHYGFLLSRFALTIVLRLKTKNIVPGQQYPITVDVKNDSIVQIHQVQGKIKKYTTLRLAPPSTQTRVIRKELCSFKLDAPEVKSSKSSTALLPPLNEASVNVDSCKIIDVEYMLVVKAVTLGLHRDAKLKTRVNVVTAKPLASS